MLKAEKMTPAERAALRRELLEMLALLDLLDLIDVALADPALKS